MADARARLRERIGAELAVPVTREARRLGDAIRVRHAGAASAVVFYGSCLRERTADGVHDFHLVVDDYRAAYTSRALALANALLPPNVFYLELEDGDETLRAKYAVVSTADLGRGCAGASRRSGLWARFAQPLAAVWLRDEAAREMLVAAAVDATCTAVRAALSPRGDAWQAVVPARLWRELFRATYAAELRPEPPGASDALYTANARRYDALLRDAIPLLAEAGALEVDAGAASQRVRLLSRLDLPHPLAAKGMAALALAKSAATFGDWLPYALWKLERHSGLRLEATPRQRRHPWLFAWPLVVRALRSGALR